MTKRSPISGLQNLYSDAEQLDDSDLTAEQSYNNSIQNAIINNHVGIGVLPEVLNQNILFDSLLVSGLLDGTNIAPQAQPTDSNQGNQLEIELKNSKAAGKRTVKIAIIGLDFENNLQYDTLVFKANEVQITKKHYTNILAIFFNDFIGTTIQSFNLGGQVIIKEAKPFSLSRDPIMAAQDIEPNLFWRDFFVSSVSSLTTLLTNSLPLYNIDNLNINTGYKENKVLEENDVTTQIGQKFLATTNNIQKISLLLSVQNTNPGFETDLAWEGELVVSIFPLQSTIQCSTDIVPNLAIDFSPSNIPLAQLSFDYDSLQSLGTTLDGNPQPVDFVFSNTQVGTGNAIVPGNYYAVTLKRSGSANKCDILITAGSNISSDSRATMFTGSVWVDLPDDDLWHRVFTDAAKISDGQAYETGHGIIIPKINLDSETNAQIDYSLDGIQFTGTELYTGVVAAELEQSVPIQDQRTGNPVNSRQQFVPKVKLLNPIDLSNLSKTTEPFVVGLVADKNKKSFEASSSVLSAGLHSWTFVKNELQLKIIDDSTDGYRYDLNVNALVNNLVNGDFTNAKLIPNISEPNTFYRVAKAELCSMIYGDINGDGVVDDADLDLYNLLLGMDLNVSPPAISSISTDGYVTTYTNGYPFYADPFVNDFTVTFQLVDPATNLVVASGTDGILVVNPNDGSLATFQSASTNFSAITNLINLKLVIRLSTNECNNGGIEITSLNTSSNYIVNLRKVLLDSDKISQILRADIDGDFEITANDGYYLQNYILKAPPFPATTSPGNKIGTSFNVLKLKLDPFTYQDGYFTRNDDFYPTISNRGTVLHPIQDLYLEDTGLENHDFKNNPITFNLVKQLTWEERLISVASNARFVPTIFSSTSGHVHNSCEIDGIVCDIYPQGPELDPGTINAFVPNNLIIGDGGELQRPDGNPYKVDFEVGTIVLEIPDGIFGEERTLNVFDDFVADYTGKGITRLGFPALRFADCSLVEQEALLNNQVRFSVAVQSFSPNTNGTDSDGYSGVIVDGKIGVSMDYATGLLRLNFTNLYEDSVLQTLNTKVQINVYLKKGGFNNSPLFVDSTKVQNLLELISVFNENSPLEGSTNHTQVTQQTTTEWKDTSSTDYSASAPKASKRERRRQFTTTTSTANQVIEDGYTFGNVDFSLSDEAITRVTALLLVKKSGTAFGGTIEMKADYIREGAGPVLIGAPTITYNLTGSTLDGTTADFNINGNKIEIRVSPESADILNWRIFRTQNEGID
jgi:hypothetical protein